MGAILKGVEYVFPETRVSNEELSKEFPEYDFSKFEEKVGIKYRYWTSANETALDLAEKACLKLFARFDKNDVEYITYGKFID